MSDEVSAAAVRVDPIRAPVVRHFEQQGTTGVETEDVAPSAKAEFREQIIRPDVQNRIYNARETTDGNRTNVKEEEPFPPQEMWAQIRHQITQAFAETDLLYKALLQVQQENVISESYVDTTDNKTASERKRDDYKSLLLRSASSRHHLTEGSSSLGEHINRLQDVVDKQRSFTQALLDLRSRWRLKSTASYRVPAELAVDVRLAPLPHRSNLNMPTDVHLLCTQDGRIQASAVLLAQQLAEHYPVMTLSHDQVYAEGPDVERLLVRLQRAIFAVDVFIMVKAEAMAIKRSPMTAPLSHSDYHIATVDDAVIEVALHSRSQSQLDTCEPPTILRIALDRDQALNRGDLVITGVDTPTQRTLNLYFQQRMRSLHLDKQAAHIATDQDWLATGVLSRALQMMLHEKTVNRVAQIVKSFTQYARMEWSIIVHSRWEPVLENGLATCTVSHGEALYYIAVKGTSIILPPASSDRINTTTILDTELMARLLYKLCMWKLRAITTIARTLGATVTSDQLTVYVSTGPTAVPSRLITLNAYVDSDQQTIQVGYIVKTEGENDGIAGNSIRSRCTFESWKDVPREGDGGRLQYLLDGGQ